MIGNPPWEIMIGVSVNTDHVLLLQIRLEIALVSFFTVFAKILSFLLCYGKYT